MEHFESKNYKSVGTDNTHDYQFNSIITILLLSGTLRSTKLFDHAKGPITGRTIRVCFVCIRWTTDTTIRKSIRHNHIHRPVYNTVMYYTRHLTQFNIYIYIHYTPSVWLQNVHFKLNMSTGTSFLKIFYFANTLSNGSKRDIM